MDADRWAGLGLDGGSGRLGGVRREEHVGDILLLLDAEHEVSLGEEVLEGG